MESKRTDIADLIDHGDALEMQLHFHEGQLRAINSKKRFILLLAGTQSGKTSFGPYWLYNEMQRCGPGDYMIATPTYPLLEVKCLPEFKKLFTERLKLGVYKSSPVRCFTLSSYGERRLFGDEQSVPTHVFFGHAQDPDSLESATLKAVWLDEAGQKKFRRGSWEAIQRRLSLSMGRILITTTPYTLGWLKTELHDAALAGDPDVDLVQFRSTMNPAFPVAEFERMRERLPRWRFNMMYCGMFERPAGMIFDCFGDENKCVPFTIPDAWPRYVGLDFGGVNTAAVFIAEEPETSNLYLYRTYHEGGLTASGHAAQIRRGEPGRLVAFGGAKSEGQWRQEFSAGGLTINQPPVADVEVGINRVYGLFKQKRLFVFETLAELIDDIESYSRVLDEAGKPTEKIEDKETYHRLDGLRYIGTHLNRIPEWLAA